MQFLDGELHSLSPGQQFFPLLPAEINKLKLDGRAAAVFKNDNITALLADKRVEY